MTELLMFNPKTLDQRFVNPHKHQEIETLKEEGWVSNPRLIHMHHPHLKKDVCDMVQNRKKWEEQGYYAEPTMIYHPKDGTIVVSADDAKQALTKGWYASPAFFPGNDIGAIKTPGVMKEAS